MEKNTTFDSRKMLKVKNNDFDLNILEDSFRPEREETQLADTSDVFKK